MGEDTTVVSCTLESQHPSALLLTESLGSRRKKRSRSREGRSHCVSSVKQTKDNCNAQTKASSLSARKRYVPPAGRSLWSVATLHSHIHVWKRPPQRSRLRTLSSLRARARRCDLFQVLRVRNACVCVCSCSAGCSTAQNIQARFESASDLHRSLAVRRTKQMADSAAKGGAGGGGAKKETGLKLSAKKVRALHCR
jgi:hypothetical protein